MIWVKINYVYVYFWPKINILKGNYFVNACRDYNWNHHTFMFCFVFSGKTILRLIKWDLDCAVVDVSFEKVLNHHRLNRITQGGSPPWITVVCTW